MRPAESRQSFSNGRSRQTDEAHTGSPSSNPVGARFERTETPAEAAQNGDGEAGRDRLIACGHDTSARELPPLHSPGGRDAGWERSDQRPPDGAAAQPTPDTSTPGTAPPDTNSGDSHGNTV